MHAQSKPDAENTFDAVKNIIEMPQLQSKRHYYDYNYFTTDPESPHKESIIWMMIVIEAFPLSYAPQKLIKPLTAVKYN
jgi:hypothetical protein